MVLGQPIRNHVFDRGKDDLACVRRDSYPYQLVGVALPMKERPRDVLKAVAGVIGMIEPDPKPPAPIFATEPAIEKSGIKRFIARSHYVEVTGRKLSRRIDRGSSSSNEHRQRPGPAMVVCKHEGERFQGGNVVVCQSHSPF